MPVYVIVTITYITIQVILGILVSILGAWHVKRCQSQMKKEHDVQTSIQIHTLQNTNNSTSVDEKKNISTNVCGLWVKTVWKMRGVYAALSVHSFDVLTDLLVIIQWFHQEDIDNDHIDPKDLAYSAISIIILSRIISSAAIFNKERNIIRATLQFFDLLIFVEIYEGHKKVISQIKSKATDNAIESTLTFKYIRNFEAVFESVPEAVLQLVYVMRTSSIEPIFVVSIIQSIISMTNSIINNDYAQMQGPKWKKFKKRLPPTPQCAGHTISRLSEVIYRIGLLALFWTVCGGLAFGILLSFEITITVFRFFIIFSGSFGDTTEVWDFEAILLHLSAIIVIPSEEVYTQPEFPWTIAWWGGSAGDCVITLIFNLCCCVAPCSFCIVLSELFARRFNTEISWIPLTRIGISFQQFIFLILWAMFGDGDERSKFLFHFDHGLAIFIVTCVFYLIYTQYLLLFPNFALPFHISARSKWSYAYSNEVSELQNIKVPSFKASKPIKRRKRLLPNEDYSTYLTHAIERPLEYDCQSGIGLTAAVIATIKGHYDLVQYFESEGAVAHKQGDLGNVVLPSLEELKISDKSGLFVAAFEGNLEKVKSILKDWENGPLDERVIYVTYNIVNEETFWDEPAVFFKDDSTIYPITAVAFASAHGNDEIVQWLENNGAKLHKQWSTKTLLKLVEYINATNDE
eukprot:1041897_1